MLMLSVADSQLKQRIAGIPEELIVEAHGSFATASCTKCKTPHTMEYVRRFVETATVPPCESCGGNVKPDITFFGEDLPARYKQLYQIDMEAADLLLVIGTSLQVVCHRLHTV